MEQKIKRTMSIKQKLIVTSILLLMIPALVIGFVAYDLAKQKMTEQILQSAHSGVDRMNDEIQNIIDPMRRDVAFFADRIDGTLYQKEKQNAALKEKMTEYLDMHPQAANIYFATTDGDMNIFPEQVMPDDYDPRERSWYQSAEAAGGKVVITDPYVDAASNKMMVTLSQTTGNGRGVVAIDVDVDRIAEIAKKIKIGKEGYVMILDSTKKIVTHPTLKPGEKATGKWVSSLYANPAGQFGYEFENKGKQMDFMTNDLTKWKVAGTLYDHEITGATSSILWTTLAVIGGMLLVAAIFIYFILRSILRPLGHLTRGAERIQSGDLTEPVIVESNDEVGQVAQSFNVMVDSLRSIIINLDQSITQVAGSSQELMANSAQTTSASEQIAGSIQQVAAGADQSKRQLDANAVSLQSITAGIMRIAESSTDVSELSRSTATEAENGTVAVLKNVEQMKEIDASVQNFGGVISSLAHRSNEIGMSSTVSLSKPIC